MGVFRCAAGWKNQMKIEKCPTNGQ